MKKENKLIKLNVGKFKQGGFIPSAREMYENEINIYGKKPNISNFMVGGETLREPNPITTPQQETYQQENKTPLDIQTILDKYNTQGQFTETSPEDHEILLNYILSERERDEIQNGIKQKGGIIDPNGYLISNLSNFTPVKVINGDANGTNITTNGMAFPIKANNQILFPNTGNYQFKESKVVEYPMFQKGGKTTTSSTPFDPYFQQAEKKYNLPSGLLKGIAATESAFDPDIIAGKRKSSAGAIGLMQFMAPTAKQYGIDPTDPIQSIDAAGRMVKELYNEFGNYDDALRAYNFGSGNLKKAKAGKKEIPLETSQYVGKVYKNANLQPEVENQFDIYKETLGVGSRRPKRSKMNFFQEEDYTIQEEIEEQEEVVDATEQMEEEQEIQETEQEIQNEVDETNEDQFMSAEEIQNEILNIEQEERRNKVLNFLNSFKS